MHDHARRFLDLATHAQALRFGAFTLKSGRSSPYFFNAGSFDSGATLATLAGCYADAVDAAGLDFDLMFGPAYKGIPLATALALEFARRGRDLPLAFDRKEAKAHGEGGHLIGAAMAGRRVLVVDDVITAGTAISHSLALIVQAGGTPAGVVIALDRQEVLGDQDGNASGGHRPGEAHDAGPLRVASRQSAAQAVMARERIPVVAIATLTDLLAFADGNATLAAQRDGLLAYRTRYGSVPAT